MRTQIVCSNVDQVQAELCTQSHAHTPAAPVATSTTAWASTIAPVATAHISVRFVPNQHAEQLVGALEQHLQSTFAARRSSNTLAISLVRRGDWWYSDPSAPHYVAAARAIESVWQQRPSFIREGGSLSLLRLCSLCRWDSRVIALTCRTSAFDGKTSSELYL
jgi:acetylornithine deacetylase/succinyl-diaminopimelate desuccinylase-like protein